MESITSKNLNSELNFIDDFRVNILEYMKNNPEILNNILEDIIEDRGMANAIEEGLKSENSTFDEVYSILGV